MIKARIEAQNSGIDLRQICKSFSWSEAEKEFSWHLTGKMNIVHEAVDRWAADPDKQNRKALIFEKTENIKTYTYLDLMEISSRWATCLLNTVLKPGF
ncbi:MAG: hypothetical protein GY749_44180 [Desulfobacteraceae bacterium]|nr:hypothetical protein [Desulfobacteraceae bacterium]